MYSKLQIAEKANRSAINNFDLPRYSGSLYAESVAVNSAGGLATLKFTIPGQAYAIVGLSYQPATGTDIGAPNAFGSVITFNLNSTIILKAMPLLEILNVSKRGTLPFFPVARGVKPNDSGVFEITSPTTLQGFVTVYYLVDSTSNI